MYLASLSVFSFKNIATAEMCFSSGLNCFVGANGSGKTNLLDAIYYLSLTKSSLNASDASCINHDESFFMLKGTYELPSSHRELITASFRRQGGKQFRRGSKEYERISEHVGLFPSIMISPQDVALVAEGGDERRRFINSFLSQMSCDYLNLMMRYNTLLASRNKLLKTLQGQQNLLEIISDQLSDLGDRIHTERARFIEALAPIVAQFYAAISGGRECIEIAYKSQLSEGGMRHVLAQNLQRDMILGHTSVGIHRDDIVMNMDGYPIRMCGSQGQQKSLLIALKLAQAKMVDTLCHKKAILLLDDVFDKLDTSRVSNLVEVVASEHFGQIFITDSDKTRLENIVERFADNYNIFGVDGGVIV